MVTTPTYIFPPIQEDAFVHHVEMPKIFSPPECEAIIQYGLSLQQQKATIGKDTVDTSFRASTIAWVEHTTQTGWMWDKLSQLVQETNKRYYNFRLLGFLECAQFTEYEGEGAHYIWHMDYGAGALSKRKLSLTLQLSDPSEYEGGNLELFYGTAPFFAQKERGNVIIFPSYVMHRVTPLTSGKRYSLVVWVSGGESYR